MVATIHHYISKQFISLQIRHSISLKTIETIGNEPSSQSINQLNDIISNKINTPATTIYFILHYTINVVKKLIVTV